MGANCRNRGGKRARQSNMCVLATCTQYLQVDNLEMHGYVKSHEGASVPLWGVCALTIHNATITLAAVAVLGNVSTILMACRPAHSDL
jgi:hypothetical protein